MIPLPKKPKMAKKGNNQAVFEIEALYPGYGVTIGNSLRRVLLSSLEGAAVTQVRIKGVSHEFSKISGVLEDVLSILLNIKQLRFKILGEESQKASLKVKTEKKVKGSDFKLPTQLELVNKNCHIATLTDKKASLEIEIEVGKGIGYVKKETRKKEKLEVGIMLLDSIYTPVRRVSFNVENMRVGKRTDFDRLSIDIETDGTISPEEAFSKSSDILFSHFELLSEIYKEKEEKKHEEKKKRKKTK